MDPWNSWNNVPQLRQSFSSARLIGITLRVSSHYEPRYSNPLSTKSLWMFLKKGVPQNGWFTMEHLIKMGDFGVPLFLETPIL